MAYGSGRAFVAGLRAIGMDADITGPSDSRTREIGGRYTSGDECYPAKVTVGDFLKVLERPDIDPARCVFFMPTADGPCRFGQYATYLTRILEASGHTGVEILSPTSQNAYNGLGDLARPFVRTGWRTLVAADLLQKLMFKFRPRELHAGDTDRVYEESLEDLCRTIEAAPIDPAAQLAAMHDSMARARDRFRTIRISNDDSIPVIGVVGEIFCRLHTFSNEDLIRRIEEYGAEARLSDLTEWIWYTVSEQFRRLRLKGRTLSLEMAGAWIRKKVQLRDEHVLAEPLAGELRGSEEPPVDDLLALARPYLPSDGAFGEMVLSIGKTVYLARHGADGIIDISPFTCMNGIVCEAIYPRLSRDLGGIPIRNFYFDGTETDLDRDLGVYMELVRTYQRRKNFPRTQTAAVSSK